MHIQIWADGDDELLEDIKITKNICISEPFRNQQTQKFIHDIMRTIDHLHKAGYK
jgi:hypothetical protein